jgi:hypothetical protein
MTRFLIISILLAFCSSVKTFCQDSSLFIIKSDNFFNQYVQKGNVFYNKIKENPDSLNQLTDIIAKTNLDNYTDSEKKAFLINSYNILVIKSLADNYPVKKTMNIPGFFDGIKHQVAGRKMTLNQLEKKELLKKYKDARLHFVLVCGAIGCPPVANFSYKPEQLEEQLNIRTTKAVNDSAYVYYDDFSNTISVTRIFEWYASDFTPDVRTFIDQYRTTGLPDKGKLRYYKYNWNLNDALPLVDSSEVNEGKSDFTPIIVAATLPKKTFEINLFNSVFTANYSYNNSRSTYFTGFFQFGYGLTGNFDLGVDFLLKSNKTNDTYESSPFRVFEFRRGSELVRTSDSLYAYADFGLTHAGPRIRWSPFKKISFTYEQGIYAPIPSIPSGKNFDKSWYWVTQFYYDHQFNRKFGAFVALTFWQPIVPGEKFKFQIPYLKFFFSWFASKRFTLYATTTSLTEWGIGAKFLITPNFEIQALYTYYIPFPGIHALYVGEAQNVMTFNLGIRYRFAHQ